MELLETLETIRAADATNARLFGGEGARVRNVRATAAYAVALAEAAKLLADVYQGKRPLHHLQEAMTTSDFPQLFGDILERQMLANYAETPYMWNRIARRSTVRDFRTVKRFYVNGGEGVLDEVAEQANYPAAALADGEYTYVVKKHGRRYPFSWEAMINDDLNALQDTPTRMGRAARRSESRFATTLYVASTGPDATLYSVGNANLITGNPVLSVSGLQAGLTQMTEQEDADGDPIGIDGVTLVVPQALEVTAMNIVNALQFELTEDGGSSNSKLITANWVKTRLQVAVDPYAGRVNTTSGATAWYLFANPNTGRPALELGFLRGHEQPEMFMKAPNQQRIGGGVAGQEDFDTDSLEYKLRHIFGGGQMDPKATVASSGAGA